MEAIAKLAEEAMGYVLSVNKSGTKTTACHWVTTVTRQAKSLRRREFCQVLRRGV
jgi:hypothetical protein